MAGLVRGAEGLTGALLKAWHAVNDMDAGTLSKIGRVFQDSSKSNPKYFVTGNELPIGMGTDEALAFLNKKHGNANFDPGLLSYENGRNIESNTNGARMSYEGRLKDSPDLHRAGILKSGLMSKPRAGMSGDTSLYVADTMANGQDASAKRTYPALWDYVLSRPDAANMAPVLSASNGYRRSANMAGAYEKYGEKANRILISPDQLDSVYREEPSMAKLSQFHKLPIEAQIGALNAATAQRAPSEVQRILQELRTRARGGENQEFFSKRLADLGRVGINADKGFELSTDVDPEVYGTLGRVMVETGKAIGKPSAVGESSLRRAAITSDALKGLTARDLEGQSYLTDRLGRRTGGPVPRA